MLLDEEKMPSRVKRIEALCDSLCKMYGALDPLSDAYQLRNPLLLRAFNPKHSRDSKGRRVFSNFVAGYDNAILDLKIKCSGKGRGRLTPESPLVDLLHLYGNPSTALKSLVRFLRHALNDDTIPESVPLGWFLIEPEEKTEAANG
jgi:hypothetical protein